MPGGQGIYYGYKCREFHGKFNPTEHQVATLKAYLASPYKGMLLYHRLGSGKTCTSLMIADEMLLQKKVKHVYVITPGNLRNQWIEQYCNVCGKHDKLLHGYYTFITYNYNVHNKLPDFSNSLVIIDEVHNLINGVKNKSKNYSAIYKCIEENNCRVLGLSGTPIMQYIWEWPILGNMLKPGAFPNIMREKEIDQHSFEILFNIDAIGNIQPKNPTKFKRSMEGIISYFPGAGYEFYPEVEYMDPVEVYMTEPQEAEYFVQQDVEKTFDHPPSESLKRTDPEKYNQFKRLYIMARRNILTRRASNFFYGPELMAKKDLPVQYGGWVDHKALEDQSLLRIHSPKFVAVIINLLLHYHHKHVLFTFFKQKSGVMLLNSLFRMCGIRSAIYTGDMNPREREIILQRFNAPENRYGDDIKILLITEAGVEGINIREARHMHILESGTREIKIQQAIGRIVRYKSHYNLPKHEQKVQVWRYWSMGRPGEMIIDVERNLPDGTTKKEKKVITDKETIDKYLYDKGDKSIVENESFLKLIQKYSVTPY